jgi:hypothetical protein
MSALPSTITIAGKQAVINATNNGLTGEIVKVAFGDHQHAIGEDLKSLVALTNQMDEATFTGSQKVGTNGFTINAMVTSTASAQYEITEIGWFLSTGELFAIAVSEPGVPFGLMTPGEDRPADFTLRLEDITNDQVTIINNNSFNVPHATEEVVGIVELQDQAEVDAGTDTTRALSIGRLTSMDSTSPGAVALAQMLNNTGELEGGGGFPLWETGNTENYVEGSDGKLYILKDGGDPNVDPVGDTDGNWSALDASTSLPGEIITWATDTPPDGYFECDGAEVDRALYPELFSAIGTTFGVGDGATTFNLPDLRGEFIRGWDNGRGFDVGRVFGSSQIDEFKSHNHGLNIGAQFIAFARNDINPSLPNDGTGYQHGNNGNDIIINIASNGGDETRPKNIALMYCIKY